MLPMRQIAWLRTHRLILPLFILVTATPFVVGLALTMPIAIVLLLIGALGLLSWERIYLERAMHQFASRVLAGDIDAKFEVKSGAWGRICHAVNGLLQRQRLSTRALQMLPALPSKLYTRSDLQLPSEGSERPMTILVIGYTASARTGGGKADLTALHALAATVHEQVEQQGVLLQQLGNMILIAFGTFEERPLSSSLQQALQTAQAVDRAWKNVAPQRPLTMSLACGNVLAATLPGIGYTLIGAPIEQAQRLQTRAAEDLECTCICSEDAYRVICRSPNNAWLPTDLHIGRAGNMSGERRT